MRLDMMAYDIWIVAAGIFETVLDFKIWKKFLNSNYISQQTAEAKHKYTTIKKY